MDLAFLRVAFSKNKSTIQLSLSLEFKNDSDGIYQPKFGLEFNALIFNLSVQFFGLMIHSRTPDFNFSTSEFFRVF